jgi:hypothetical protein
VAQTKKKRRKKHKGTQGGRIDSSRRRAKPRTRAEAKSQARARRSPSGKVDNPPTWRSAILRGLVAAVLFTVLIVVIFKRSAGSALALGGFMLIFYVPAGYYIDMMMWRKRERARIRERGEPK